MSAGTPPTKSSDRRWPLAALDGIEPELIVHAEERNPLDSFFLALALCFNDLKTLVLLLDWLGPDPPGQTISPDRGQWNGIYAHTYRYAAGLLHELLELLRRQRSTIEDPRFQGVLVACAPGVKAKWKELVALADGAGDASSVLARIRNNAAYHYYNPSDLVRGFRKHFFESKPSEINKAAYVSFGRTMEASRFYFADAAAEQALNLSGGGVDIVGVRDLIHELMNLANLTLFPLVTTFLQLRRRGKKAAPRSGRPRRGHRGR